MVVLPTSTTPYQTARRAPGEVGVTPPPPSSFPSEAGGHRRRAASPRRAEDLSVSDQIWKHAEPRLRIDADMRARSTSARVNQRSPVRGRFLATGRDARQHRRALMARLALAVPDQSRRRHAWCSRAFSCGGERSPGEADQVLGAGEKELALRSVHPGSVASSGMGGIAPSSTRIAEHQPQRQGRNWRRSKGGADLNFTSVTTKMKNMSGLGGAVGPTADINVN